MSVASKHPVAFYHQDGLVPAWTFASNCAGEGGHIATLPEIVELRLNAKEGTNDSPWENWYTSASAEYVGVGADGRIKIIVAHGVGPMATIDGIKAAYKWEWGDKTRRQRGGRITAQQFLDLEAGKYGKVKKLHPHVGYHPAVTKFTVAPVNVLDFSAYLRYMGNDVFSRYMTASEALSDPLLRMRLGQQSHRYFLKHERIAKAFHAKEQPNRQYPWAGDFDDRSHPYITKVESAFNCAYTLPNEAIRRATRRWVYEPRVPEQGYALAHLLGIGAFRNLHTQEVGVMLMSAPNVHEWWNGAKFIAVPSDATLGNNLLEGPNPAEVIRKHWRHFMQTVEDDYTPVTPYLLKYAYGEWFACYPKQFPDDQCMDDGNVEFHVRSVKWVGGDRSFTTNEDFFLRYTLAQVRALMPREANSYEIVNVSAKDRHGLTTVTVRFYAADVDISSRLPRAIEVARDYDRLMEAWMMN
ncbi:MAG: hypothetical protein WAQ25_03020 [Candidatus Saccharimonas sp.]